MYQQPHKWSSPSSCPIIKHAWGWKYGCFEVHRRTPLVGGSANRTMSSWSFPNGNKNAIFNSTVYEWTNHLALKHSQVLLKPWTFSWKHAVKLHLTPWGGTTQWWAATLPLHRSQLPIMQAIISAVMWLLSKGALRFTPASRHRWLERCGCDVASNYCQFSNPVVAVSSKKWR